MKLLHSGDLHLGKSLHETSLLDDQKYMLDNLRSVLSKDDYSVLLLAGDIYDRTIPPAEAVELFSDFLVRTREDFPDLTICIIPGNHDCAQRLSYADRILGRHNIHIVCNPEQSFKPVIIKTKKGEHLAVFLLPFLSAGTLKIEHHSKEPLELDFDAESIPVLLSQVDLASEAARRFGQILPGLKNESGEDMPSVLLAHLFTLSGMQSDSERLFIGSAEQVNPSLFPHFTYVALGHLHRSQKITERMYYAGSPLAYAFDEAGTEKVFLSVEIDCSSPGFPVTVKPIPVNPFRKVTRLSGSFDEFYNGTSFDKYSPDYVEITLTDENLVANPINLLRPKFPALLSIKQGAPFDERGNRYETSALGDTGDGGSKAAEKRDPVADFCRFEEMLYGSSDSGKKNLFAKLLAECTDET